MKVVTWHDSHLSIQRGSLAVRSIMQEIEESGLPMIGYMSLEEQIDADFTRARRKALLRRIVDRLRRDTASDGLLCFDEITKVPGAVGRLYRGKRTVSLGQIVGSVGRCSDFDRDFMPSKASVEERWKRIDKAFHREERLRPVSLYKIGGAYFVLDGHHRVSVFRYHGVEWIDAYVTEFRTPRQTTEMRRAPEPSPPTATKGAVRT